MNERDVAHALATRLEGRRPYQLSKEALRQLAGRRRLKRALMEEIRREIKALKCVLLDDGDGRYIVAREAAWSTIEDLSNVIAAGGPAAGTHDGQAPDGLAPRDGGASVT